MTSFISVMKSTVKFVFGVNAKISGLGSAPWHKLELRDDHGVRLYPPCLGSSPKESHLVTF